MSRRQALAIVIGLILLGFTLRVYRIDAVSFRGDEAFTVLNWVSRPLLETLQSDIPLKDPQPPLAFALFRGWALILGTSEFSMRVLPALLSLVGIPALYALGHRMNGRKLGVLAALLWTVHPFLVWHAQDARAYAIWVSFSATAIWLALRALEKGRRTDWLLYIVIATGTLYVYYLELFTLVALNVYVLVIYRRNWRTLRRWIVGQIVIGGLLAPWLLQERLLAGNGYGGTSFPFEPAQISTWILPSLNFGRTISNDLMLQIWPLILLALVLGLLALGRINRRYALLLGMIGTIPIALLSLFSLKLNVFTPRYVLSTIPAYVLLFAALILGIQRAIRQPLLKRALPITLAGSWLFLAGFSLNNYYFVPAYAKAPDWRGLTDYLRETVGENDLVIKAAPDEVFTLYYQDFSDLARLPANPGQSRREITGILQTASQTYGSLWLVAQTPPDWPNANVAPGWLNRNMQQVRNTHIDNLRVQQFMPWQVRENEKMPLATFDHVAQLNGIHMSNTPDPALLIWANWQPLAQTESPLKAFVHLIGPVNPATGSPLWSQDDHVIQGRRVDSTNWSTTETYRDIFQLPLAGVPPGDYELHIGLYDPESEQRVSVSASDSYLIGTVTLP